MKIIAVYSTILGAALIWPGAPDGLIGKMGAILPAAVSPHRLEPVALSGGEYETAAVEGVQIPKSVTATGTLNASIIVEVGSQLSGQIVSMQADYNDVVSKGQVLAQLDHSSFKEQVDAAQATLDSARADARTAEARLARASIDVQQIRAQRTVLTARVDNARIAFEMATRETKRKASLFEKGAAPANDVQDSTSRRDAASAALREAEANLEAHSISVEAAMADVTRVAAEVDSARAGIRRLEAQLATASLDLERTSIRSPIDGVVVGRSVTEGQTLASSLEARTLFNIAGDLRHMEIHARVDESDIASIALGQTAAFTVDSFPGRDFKAQVTQIRKAPQVVQNVVTYTVVLSVDNENLALFPGMTVVAKIAVETEPASVSVPLAALRYKPAASRLAQGDVQSPPGAVVWVLHQGDPRPISIVTGADDGARVAIRAGDLKVGDRVLVGDRRPPMTGWVRVNSAPK